MGKRFRPALLMIPTLVFLLSVGCDRETDSIVRIGILSGFGTGFPTVGGFVDGMAELGYAEGDDVVFDIREVSLDADGQPEVVGELLEDGANLIFAFPTEPSLTAKAIAGEKDIPVVFAVSTTEVVDLIESMDSPGEGITGVRYPTLEVTLKRYEILRAIIPDARRIAVLYDEKDPRINLQMVPLRAMAAEDGVDLVEVKAETKEELIVRVEERAAGGTPDFDAILIIIEPLAIPLAPFLVQFCETYRIPIGGYPYSGVMTKTLFSVGIDYYETGRLAATLADKVIRGTPAGSLPVLSSEMHIVVNNAQAEELGLEIPQSILAMADEIIMD